MGGLGDKMLQAKWIAFQIVVAMLTFVWIGTWADITSFGLAPGIISMVVAFAATGLLAAFIDWRATRRLGIGKKASSENAGLVATRRDIGDVSQHPSRLRVGQ